MAIVVGDDEIPAWATLDMSAEHCYTMLREEFKLDEDAVQDMFSRKEALSPILHPRVICIH